MTKVKFRYNPETCRYEPFYVRGKALRNRLIVFLALSAMAAFGGYLGLRNYFETVDELLLAQKNHELKVEWNMLHTSALEANEKLAGFIDKDDNNYRMIVDSQPLPRSIREAGVGGSDRIQMHIIRDFPHIINEYTFIEKLKHKVDVEIQSYDEIGRILDRKIAMWAARPALQPLSNADLLYLHVRYGSRMHPLLGFVRDHRGLDFTADTGTPVYATGDGTIKMAYFSESFGKVIFLDHGFGYETRYAHLSQFNVRKGQRVKRGEIIGHVGSTGLSGGPHLHYEVLFEKEHVNPIHFFQRDLSKSEFQKIVNQVKE